ncbi:hypothetical protein [Streptomyces sp. NBRC 110465]|nr:hypothetical protein [Streptomyces sp. NBRC 110465]
MPRGRASAEEAKYRQDIKDGKEGILLRLTEAAVAEPGGTVRVAAD